MFNVCEDSLLATPLIIDLAILAELFTRVTYASGGDGEHQGMYSIISLLSYMLKARASSLLLFICVRLM